MVIAVFVASIACGESVNSNELGAGTDRPQASEETLPTLQPTGEQVQADPPAPSIEALPQTNFSIGQIVYLVPELVEAGPGPYGLGRAITKLSDNIALFETVSNCDDLTRAEEEVAWVFHNLQGEVIDVLPCGETTFYRVSVGEFLYADEWDDWILEEQISENQVSPVGFPFVLKLRSDQPFPDPYSPYLTHLPVELISRAGDNDRVFFADQPARMALLGVSEVSTESNIYRSFSIVFRLTNEGTDDIIFDSSELLAGKYNKVDVEANPSDELIQEVPAEVVVPPNESIDFEVLWQMFEIRSTERTLAFYITVNTPIHNDLYVFVNENSLFFRELVQLQ